MVTQQDKHSPEPKRLSGSLLPGHCSAPAKRSENSTLGIGRYGLLATVQLPKGLWGTIHMRPCRRYITPKPVVQTPARSGALVKAWNRSLICDPQLLPRRPKHRIPPTRVHGPNGAGRHNRSQLHPTITATHLENLWLTCVPRTTNTLVDCDYGTHRVASPPTCV